MNRAESRSKILFSVLVLLLFIIAPAAAIEPSLWGGEIPVISGAKIIKEKQFQGSGSLELEADIPPAEVAEFYVKVLQDKGWPAGSIMTVGKNSGFMLTHGDDTFALKAEAKDGRTRVTLQMIRRSSIEAAMNPQSAMESDKSDHLPVAEKDSVALENTDRGITLEGVPFGMGALIRRPDFGTRQNSPLFEEKDGNLPEDPDSGDSPESEDAPSEDAPSEDLPPEDAPSEDAGQAHSGDAFSPPETIPVSIVASAEWNEIVRNADGEEIEEKSGSSRMFINGTMTLDRKASPVVNRQGIMAMPTERYAPDNLSFSYIYREEVYDRRPAAYRGKCKDPLKKRYHGSHGGTITDGPGLIIANFSSSASPFMDNLSEQEKQFAAQLQSQLGKQMPDWYQFVVSGGTPGETPRGVKVKGVRATGPPDCTFKDVEKNFPGFSIGLQMQLPPSGTMTGYRNWQADCDGCFPPSFGLSVSDLAEFGGEAPLDPPEGGKRNVTYTLSWYLGVEPSPISAGAGDGEEEDENCKRYQKELNFLRLKIAGFGNRSIREYCKGLDGNPATQKEVYQKAVENAVGDAIKNNQDFTDQLQAVADAKGSDVAPPPSAEYSGEAPSWQEETGMTEEPLCAAEALDEEYGAKMVAQPWGDPVEGKPGTITAKGFEIVDYCTGEPVRVANYDLDGGEDHSAEISSAKAGALKCWQKKYGEQFGKTDFEKSLHHERTHIGQFVMKGPVKGVDDKGDRELEAMQRELEDLLDDMEKHDCL